MANELPGSEDDADAMGFRPIEDFETFIQVRTGLSLAEYERRRARLHTFGARVMLDCAVAENRGQPCQHDKLVDGTIWICFCQENGSCGGCRYR